MNDTLPPHETPPLPERRSFLEWMCIGLGGLFGVILGCPIIAYLIDPRHRKVASGDFQPVARLNQFSSRLPLLKINVPHQVAIKKAYRDAWTYHPDEVVGRVWLVRRSDDTVDAYTATCPHLGCSINYAEDSQEFICPCHGGTWNRSCQRVTKPGISNPAPRDMDSLECHIDTSNGKKVVLVKFQKFIQNIKKKEPKT